MKVFSLVKLVFLSIGHCIERVLCNILNVLCDVYINISLNTSSSIVTPNIRSAARYIYFYVDLDDKIHCSTLPCT